MILPVMTKKLFALFFLGTLTCATLGGCSNAFRNIEEPYMKPGALDPNIPNAETAYSRRSFIFMNRYRVSHEWLRFGCHHGSLQVGPQVTSIPTDLYAGAIYEKDDVTWQESLMPDVAYNLNRYVRSVIRHQPIYIDDKGVRSSTPLRYEDQEQGLQAMCFQAWVGTSHAITLMLYKRSLEQWDEILKRWSNGAYADATTKRSNEMVSGNTWRVYRSDIRPRVVNRLAGPFELHLLPIGDTDYTMAFEIGANQDSLLHPQAHAAMQAMFRRLVESVKIEPLTPALEAEQAQLKAQAEEIQRQECVESAKLGKPSPWCKVYGVQ